MNKRKRTNWMVVGDGSRAQVLASFTEPCFVSQEKVSVPVAGLWNPALLTRWIALYVVILGGDLRLKSN